jgi:uncharacterized protein (TIGR00369 family)
MENKLSRVLGKINRLPLFTRSFVTKWIIGLGVPYIRTTGIQFEKTSTTEWTATLKNKRRVRNHLKQVHAGAMVLLAETVAVFLTALNLPNDRIPLVKKIEADFVKRSTGGLRATASLSAHQIDLIQCSGKGEIVIEVHLTDETGIQPVIIKVTAAWITKKDVTLKLPRLNYST